MKVILYRQADKDYKAGDQVKFETEIEQSELDAIIRERVQRIKQDHQDELKEVKAGNQKAIDEAVKPLNEKLKEAEAAKKDAEELLKTEKKSAETRLALAEKKEKVLAKLLGDGTKLPDVYLKEIKIEAADDDAAIEKKIKEVVDKFQADFKKLGGKTSIGPEGNGANSEALKEWADSELLALARREHKILVAQCKNDDGEILRLMKQKAVRGELKKAAK